MFRYALKQLPKFNGKLREAVSILNDVDGYRNLHVGATICIFVFCAVASAYLSFYLIEICIRLGIDKIDPMIPVFMAYMMFFVLWVLIFLAVLSTLEIFGFRNIQLAARTRLSKLTLSRDELDRLSDVISSGKWRYHRIFKDVVCDLSSK